MTLQLRDAQSGSDSARSLALSIGSLLASHERFIPVQRQNLPSFQLSESRALSREPFLGTSTTCHERRLHRNGSELSAPPVRASKAQFDAAQAIEVLREFREEDEKDQQETLQFLIETLDEQRPEGCKIFSKP